MDSEDNSYLTDSLSGWVRLFLCFPYRTLHIDNKYIRSRPTSHPFNTPTKPTGYFVNGTTIRPKELWYLEGNTNGVAISPEDATIYISDMGASRVKPSSRDEQGQRDLWAFDFAMSPKKKQRLPLLTNRQLLTRAMQYFYDGVGVGLDGWIFGVGGEVVDVVDPESGWILGSIRSGGGGNDPVNAVFGEHELWLVQKEGVWHVKNVEEKLST